MIKSIATAAVYVSDQKQAEAFWLQKVEFEVRAKHDMGNGAYWVEVSPPGAQSRLVLYPRSLMKDWQERKVSIVFECRDLDTTYQRLKELGVNVGPAPQLMSWGKYATFQDPDGNRLMLIQMGR